MSLRTNVIATYLGQGWTGLAGFIFIPVYIKFLGIEAYGLIGFFATLQACFTLLDLGMSPTIGREMARYAGGQHSAQSIRDLLRSIECILSCVAITVVVSIFFATPWIASSWIQSKIIPNGVIIDVLKIMGLIIAIRLLGIFHRSALIGLQKHITLNIATATFASVRAGGSVIILAYVTPSILAFFVYQGIIYLLESVFLFASLERSLPKSASRPKFKLKSLIEVWRFAAGMSTVTILAILLMQVDKLLLSKVVTLSQFGIYMLASTIANALYLLIMPISQVMRPNLAEHVARCSPGNIKESYHHFSQLLTVVIAPVAVVISLFSDHFLLLWTRDPDITASASSILSILVIGTMLNGLMNPPYALQLAHGKTKFSIWMNFVAVVILVPSIYFGVNEYGSIAAAVAWLTLNLGYFFIAAPLLHRSFFPEVVRDWYIFDIGAPLLACAVVSASMFLISSPPTLLRPWDSILLMSSTFLLALIASVFSTKYGVQLIQKFRSVKQPF